MAPPFLLPGITALVLAAGSQAIPAPASGNDWILLLRGSTGQELWVQRDGSWQENPVLIDRSTRKRRDGSPTPEMRQVFDCASRRYRYLGKREAGSVAWTPVPSQSEFDRWFSPPAGSVAEAKWTFACTGERRPELIKGQQGGRR